MTRTPSHWLTIWLLALILTLAPVALEAAADDWLDPAFDGDGKVTTDFAGGFDEVRDLALQEDGKLVVVGPATVSIGGSLKQGFGVARYLADGALDPTFGNDGKSVTVLTSFKDKAMTVVIQKDGYIVVGGQSATQSDSDFALVRYKPDGFLDETFGKGGIVLTDLGRDNDQIADLALQSDGRIIAVGRAETGDNSDFAVVRYYTNGSLDAAFGNGGIVITEVAAVSNSACAIRILAGDKILAAGSAFGATPAVHLVRYNADGSLDPTFDGDGIARPDIGSGGGTANDMIVQRDGTILVAGMYQEGYLNKFGVTRVNPGGTTDVSFGENGHAFTPQPINGVTALALQRDGKILLAGRYLESVSTALGVVRFNKDGSLDASFGSQGIMWASYGSYAVPYAISVVGQGHVILGGATDILSGASNDFALARFLNPLPPMFPVWLPLVTR